MSLSHEVTLIQGCSCLWAWLRLKNLLPSSLLHRANPSVELLKSLPNMATGFPKSERSKGESKEEATVLSVSEPWKWHNNTSAIFCWSHNQPRNNVGENCTRAWISRDADNLGVLLEASYYTTLCLFVILIFCWYCWSNQVIWLIKFVFCLLRPTGVMYLYVCLSPQPIYFLSN